MAEEEGKAIQWPAGADEATDFDFLMVGKDDEPIMKIPKEKLNEVIVINGDGVKAVTGGATSSAPTILRPGPNGQNRKMEDVIGWFVNGTAAEPPVATGTAWEAPAGKKNTNWWDGTAKVWSLGSSVDLPKAENKIPQYDPLVTYTAGQQFIKREILYQVNEGQTFNPGEVVEKSSKLSAEIGAVNSVIKIGQSDVKYSLSVTHLTYFVKDEPIGVDGLIDSISFAQTILRDLSAQIIICEKIVEEGQPDKMRVVGVYLKIIPASTQTLDLKSLNINVTANQYFGLKGLTSATPSPSISLYKAEVRGNVDTYYFAGTDGVVGKESSNKVANKLEYDFSYTVSSVKSVSDQFKIVDQNISNIRSYLPIGVEKMVLKIMFCFGTSITWYDGQPYGANHSEKPNICKGYLSYFREYLQCQVSNFGGSGHNLTQISATIKTKNYAGVDFVTIEGGVNDWAQGRAIGSLLPIGSAFDVNTSYGALQSAIEYIINSNKSTKIYLLGTIRGWIDSLGVYPETYMTMFKEIGKLYGIPFLDWYNECGFNSLNKSYFYKDIATLADRQIHVGDEGYKIMGELAVGFISGR